MRKESTFFELQMESYIQLQTNIDSCFKEKAPDSVAPAFGVVDLKFLVVLEGPSQAV